MTFITLPQSGSIIDLDSVSFVTRIQSKTAGRGIRITIIVGWIVIFSAITAGAMVLLVLLLPILTPYFIWRGLRSARIWLSRNLPPALVLRYRSWQFRRMGRQLRGG